MAYLALYRKYRPGNFDEVVGQNDVVRILKNQILSDRIGHAYLFTGIRGTGKTSIAKIFARAVNCRSNREGNPCNQCEVCQNIDRPSVMDIIEIDAASNRGVDEIRDIREKVVYPPKIGRYKVYIIDEVHMLTKEAFNALLKTLEEPPSHIIFILATTEVNKLPATILSRCQRFDIRPIAQEKIAEQIRHILEENHVAMEEEAIQLIAARGDHSMRDALSILDQAIDIRNGDEMITGEAVLQFLGMTSKSALMTLTEAVFKSDAVGIVECLNGLKQNGTDSILLTGQVIELMRQVMIVQTVGKKAKQVLESVQSEIDDLMKLSKMIEPNRLFKIINDLIEDRQKMRFHDCPDIILEMSLLKQCIKGGKNDQQSLPAAMKISDSQSVYGTDSNRQFTQSKNHHEGGLQSSRLKHSEDSNKAIKGMMTEIAPQDRNSISNNTEKKIIKKEEEIDREKNAPGWPEAAEHADALPKNGTETKQQAEIRGSSSAEKDGTDVIEKAESITNPSDDNLAAGEKKDEILMLRQEIENWNQSQDFFTAQIVSYGHLKNSASGQYVMVYQAPDHNMYAEMFKGRIQKQVEDLLSGILEKDIHIDVACSSKKYEEMDLFEKTAAIVGDGCQSKIQVND